VTVFSTSNPLFNISIPFVNLTTTTPAITFSTVLNSGQYGFQLYDSVYGWYLCKSVLNVSPSGAYTVSNVQTSFNGGSVTFTGNNIGQGATVTVNGQIGVYISGNASAATFSVPALATKETQAAFSLVTPSKLNLTNFI
jgi:hypothetical protein